MIFVAVLLAPRYPGIKLLKPTIMYDRKISDELIHWQQKMQKSPSLVDLASKTVQDKINEIIPDKIHEAITSTVKQMTRAVLFGASFFTPKPLPTLNFEEKELLVKKRIAFYKKAGAAEGSITGTGGFWLTIAEFPVLLGIKFKLLFDIASIYGYSVEDYRERLYIMYVFQLAFSSQKNRRLVYQKIANWDRTSKNLPDDIHQFDWLTFQQEYRDYIDLAKLGQMIPGIGAAVGFVVNYRLLSHLGRTAMNAYRMRELERQSGSKPYNYAIAPNH
jgi:hypothetical protein